MGLMAIYQKPKTSQPHPGNKIYPHLQRGFLSLVTMDWHSRTVQSWRLSNTLDTDFWIAAFEEAMNRYDVPEIFNTDQRSQFTSLEVTQAIKDARVSISMDSKGRWMDNVFIERLWRSVKCECIYRRELETGSQARQALGPKGGMSTNRTRD